MWAYLTHIDRVCFICDLFYDPVNGSNCVALNEGMINDWGIAKDVEAIARGLIWDTIPALCLEKLREITENLSWDSSAKIRTDSFKIKS